MDIIIKSKNCETQLLLWKKRSIRQSILGCCFPLFLFVIIYFLGRMSDRNYTISDISSVIQWILLAITAFLLLCTQIQVNKVINPTVRKYMDLCNKESLCISSHEIFGHTESVSYHVPIHDIKRLRVEYTTGTYAASSPSKFLNPVLVIECQDRILIFFSFSNCKELESILLHLVSQSKTNP